MPSLTIPTMPHSEQKNMAIQLSFSHGPCIQAIRSPYASPTEDFKSRVDDETAKIRLWLISNFPRSSRISYLTQSVIAASPPSGRTAELPARFWDINLSLDSSNVPA